MWAVDECIGGTVSEYNRGIKTLQLIILTSVSKGQEKIVYRPVENESHSHTTTCEWQQLTVAPREECVDASVSGHLQD